MRLVLSLCAGLALSVLFATACPDVRADSAQENSAPARIISLAPSLTEMLFAIGAGEQVVGVMAHSDYPPAAKKIPRIGDFSRLDYEQILALQPDLILAWQTGNAGKDIEYLRSLGLRVEETEPSTLDELAGLFLKLGKLSGHEAEAGEQQQRFLNRLAGLQTRYSRGRRLKVFYQFWADPIMTVNGEHMVSDVLALCGGENLFADLAVIAGPISVESVLERNPEVILVSGVGEERPVWLDDWLEWKQLAAVEQGNLFVVSPDLLLRQGPRILDGVEVVCRQLESARSQ